MNEIPATLYHGTDLGSLWAILAARRIERGQPDGGPAGVSLTSDRYVASGYAADAEQREAENSYPQDYDHIPEGECDGAVLVLDGERLAAAGYIIRPYVWPADCGLTEDEEFEWRLEGDLSDLLQFVTDIHVRQSDLDWYAELYGASPRGNEPFLETLRDAFERVGVTPEAPAVAGPETTLSLASTPR